MSYNIDLGGRMKGCVRIVVDVPDETLDERFAAYEKEKQAAHIAWIGYNKKCAVGDDLPKSHGTRHMIRTAMTIVMNSYDWIKQFSLMDASKVDCKDYEVSLLHSYLSLYGKTYYEKYIHAYLQENSNRMRYNAGVKLLHDNVIPLGNICSFIQNQEYQGIVKKVYDPNITNIQFFNQLKDKCTKDGFAYCEVTSNWLDALINRFFTGKVLTQLWVIDTADVVKIQTLEWSDDVDFKQIMKKHMVAQEEFSKGGASAYFGDEEL